MKAEDLKRWPLLFKKFKKNIKKHGIYGSYEEYIEDSDDIGGAFVWCDTKQKHSFWSALDDGDIEAAKALQPKLFSIDNEACKEGSSTGSYGLPEFKGEDRHISSYELPEEVWTEHGEFLSSLKCKWLPIMPSQLDTQEAETVACLLNIDRVRRVSYNTSNYCKVNYIVEGGDPSKIAETIYKYRCIGVQSVGMLSCSFKNTLGETKQASFDYVY